MADVVFVVAHQDDELLSMGLAIANHVQSGHDVYVVLATDGVNSAVRDQLGLTRTQFTRARDREFGDAVLNLGATPLLTRFGTEDGQLTFDRATDLLVDVLEVFPEARLKTHSPLGTAFRHPDHVQLGTAALQLYADKRVADLRFYVEPYVRDQFRTEFPRITLYPETAPDHVPVLAAIREYKLEEPELGRYGIGYLSVPRYFDELEAELTSYVHRP